MGLFTDRADKIYMANKLYFHLTKGEEDVLTNYPARVSLCFYPYGYDQIYAIQNQEEKIDELILFEIACYHFLREEGFLFHVKFETKHPKPYYEMQTVYPYAKMVKIFRNLLDYISTRYKKIEDIDCFSGLVILTMF